MKPDVATLHDNHPVPPGKFAPFEGEAVASTAALESFLSDIGEVIRRHPEVTMSYAVSCGPAATSSVGMALDLLESAATALVASRNDPDEAFRRVIRLQATLHIQRRVLSEALSTVEAFIAKFPGEGLIEMHRADKVAAAPQN